VEPPSLRYRASDGSEKVLSSSQIGSIFVSGSTGARLTPDEFIKELETRHLTSAFRRLFGADAEKDTKLLEGILGDPTFNKNTFFEILPRVDALHTSLQGNEAAKARADFNQRNNASVLDSGTPDINTRAILFSVVSGARLGATLSLGDREVKTSEHMELALSEVKDSQSRLSKLLPKTVSEVGLVNAYADNAFGYFADPDAVHYGDSDWISQLALQKGELKPAPDDRAFEKKDKKRFNEFYKRFWKGELAFVVESRPYNEGAPVNAEAEMVSVLYAENGQGKLAVLKKPNATAIAANRSWATVGQSGDDPIQNLRKDLDKTAGARLTQAEALLPGAGFPAFADSARRASISPKIPGMLSRAKLMRGVTYPVGLKSFFLSMWEDSGGNVWASGSDGAGQIVLPGSAYNKQMDLFKALMQFERNFAQFMDYKIPVGSKLYIASLIEGKELKDVIGYLQVLAAATDIHRERGKGKNFVQFVDYNKYAEFLADNNIPLKSDAAFPVGTVERNILDIKTDMKEIKTGAGVTFFDRQKGDYYLDILSTLIVDGIIARLDLKSVAEGDALMKGLENALKQLTGNPDLKINLEGVKALKEYDPKNFSLYKEFAIQAVKAIINDYIRQYKLILDSTDWTA